MPALPAQEPPASTSAEEPLPGPGTDPGNPQAERRERILDAAVALASRGGFDAVQMRIVAEDAEVALGTLYRYFPSKIHLLVSALARQFVMATAEYDERTMPGDSAEERVLFVLRRASLLLQRDPGLTEAMTRAFMFADATVAAESQAVADHVTGLLTRAMRAAPGGTPGPTTEPTSDEAAVARLIGDVWLSGLVQWVTGRAEVADVSRSLEVAVRLLLR